MKTKLFDQIMDDIKTAMRAGGWQAGQPDRELAAEVKL